MPEDANVPIFVVLGAINMDLIGVAPRLPMPGETVVGEHFYTAPGGKGANQAVAAARLGTKVRMVGRVGRDPFGSTLLADMRGHGIDVQGVAEDPDNPSGVAMILLDSKRQNHIVAIYGSSAACDEAQVEAAKKALDGASVLLLQLEVPVEVSLEVAQHAKSVGVKVIWDPAPARAMPRDVYDSIDVLTPNQTEAAFLTGLSVKDLDSSRAAADVLLERGVLVAVVKLGEQGAYFATHKESAYVSPYQVEVVDTVAAGDAFGTALAVALVEGKSLPDAVRFGVAAGALAVTKPGAQEAMPDREEVEALVLRG